MQGNPNKSETGVVKATVARLQSYLRDLGEHWSWLYSAGPVYTEITGPGVKVAEMDARSLRALLRCRLLQAGVSHEQLASYNPPSNGVE